MALALPAALHRRRWIRFSASPAAQAFQLECRAFRAESGVLQPERGIFRMGKRGFRVESGPFHPEPGPFQVEAIPFHLATAAFHPENAPFRLEDPALRPETAVLQLEKETAHRATGCLPGAKLQRRVAHPAGDEGVGPV